MPVFVVFNLVESYFMATELSDINSFVCYILVFPWWSKCQILASLSTVPSKKMVAWGNDMTYSQLGYCWSPNYGIQSALSPLSLPAAILLPIQHQVKMFLWKHTQTVSFRSLVVLQTIYSLSHCKSTPNFRKESNMYGIMSISVSRLWNQTALGSKSFPFITVCDLGEVSWPFCASEPCLYYEPINTYLSVLLYLH